MVNPEEMVVYQQEMTGRPEATPIYFDGDHVRAHACPDYIFKIEQTLIVENGEKVRYILFALTPVHGSICLHRLTPNGHYGAWQEQLIPA